MKSNRFYIDLKGGLINMNSKKISFAFLAILMVSVFAISMVSAASTWGSSVQGGIDNVMSAISPATKLLFGDKHNVDADSSFVTWMAFLLTLLVVAGILSPMKIFGEDKEGINWAIAAIVALVGTRFIPVEALKAFTLGSQGLVGALFLIVPFVVVATLIIRSTESSAVRKLSWTVYAVVMLALFVKAWNDAAVWNRFFWVYIAIIVVCVVLFLMDGTIQKFFKKAKYEKITASIDDTEKARVIAKIADLQTAKAAVAGDAKEVKKIEAKIKALSRLLDPSTF
ncbi:MAG: hypothetical protein WCI72_03225 [archaeon]